MFEKEAEEYTKKNFCGCCPLTWKNQCKNFINCGYHDSWKDGAEFGYNKVKEELEEERKLNAEIKARFVKCNTCTDEMKSKCLMFTENLCEGERCEELIDIVSLVNKSDLERKIEALEKANEWHYVKDGDLPKDENDVLVLLENGNVEISGISTDKRWFCTDYYTGEDKVYAWKEIVLPELPKESE